MKLKKIFTYIVVTYIALVLVGGVEYRVARAAGIDDPGDMVQNPWGGSSSETPTIPDLSLDVETTTRGTVENPTKNSQNEKLKTFRKAGKVKVKTVTKKKSAKKVKITLKKTLKGANGYVVRFYKTKKNAKKNKKVLVKVTYRKNKKVLVVKHKKLKKQKTLFVRVKGYVKINGKTYYSKKWSVTKKVKIKK